MSDFGIKPPSFMLGALRTGDAITIEFDVHLHMGNQTTAQL